MPAAPRGPSWCSPTARTPTAASSFLSCWRCSSARASWLTPEQRGAARELRDFLLSSPVQGRALTFGFRPANSDVKVLGSDPENPWNRLRPFGVRFDVPAVAEPPSGEVSRLLLETWRRGVEPPSR